MHRPICAHEANGGPGANCASACLCNASATGLHVAWQLFAACMTNSPAKMMQRLSGSTVTGWMSCGRAEYSCRKSTSPPCVVAKSSTTTRLSCPKSPDGLPAGARAVSATLRRRAHGLATQAAQARPNPSTKPSLLGWASHSPPIPFSNSSVACARGSGLAAGFRTASAAPTTRTPNPAAQMGEAWGQRIVSDAVAPLAWLTGRRVGQSTFCTVRASRKLTAAADAMS